MKKLTFMACAAMLASAVALNSCKSNEPNGGPINDAEVVKTEFAISLPDNVVGSGVHKMPAATVQTDPSQFNGIVDIVLVPFATSDKVTASDARLGSKNIHLGDSVSRADMATVKAKLYEDVDIPLSTAAFLFYGRSRAAGTGATDVEKKFQVGSLVVDTTTTSTPADFSFALEPIKADYATSLMGSGKTGGLLMAYLTKIANVKDSSNIAWGAYPNNGDSAAYRAMHDSLIMFTELSSFNVERVLSDLYHSLSATRSTSHIADTIMDVIADADYVVLPIVDDSVKLKSELKNFPQSAGLPMGAICTKWNTDKFEEGTYDNGRTNPSKYAFPASLWYYANSNIKTANTSQAALYDGSKTWSEILTAHNGALAVNPSTRAVALKDSVQYAMGRLDVAVGVDNVDSLVDNSAAAEGHATKVKVPAAGFPVTAIFIGGQKAVNFDFTTNTSADPLTIYDRVMASSLYAEKNDYSDWNHTLVLETANTDDVRICVEFENNSGADFYGFNDQLIPKNSKFYVIATLPHASASETDGKVFKQDFTTKAKLKLMSLRYAYNTIPDLRTPQMELGFAVSLSWQSGHDYGEIEIP